MNTTSGLFETLVAAGSEAAANTQYQNAFLDCVFTEYQPINAEIGQTLNVNIPQVNEGDVVDIQGGPIQPTDTKHDTVAIVFDKHPSASWVLKTWDKIRTPSDLSRLYVKPKLEALMRAINRLFAGLITTANFGTYALISGSGADKFARVDLTSAWINLANAGVPIDDFANLFFVISPTAYGNMLGDTSFYQESIVGKTQAEIAQSRGILSQQLGAQVRFDQHIASYNSGKEPGVFFHRNAIAAVTANMPPSGSPAVMETTIFPKPWLPVQFQVEYSLKDQGWLFHLHCGFGLKVVRAAFGTLLETA